MSCYANTDSETLKLPKPRPLNVNCENAHSYDYESRQNESSIWVLQDNLLLTWDPNNYK